MQYKKILIFPLCWRWKIQSRLWDLAMTSLHTMLQQHWFFNFSFQTLCVYLKCLILWAIHKLLRSYIPCNDSCKKKKKKRSPLFGDFCGFFVCFPSWNIFFPLDLWAGFDGSVHKIGITNCWGANANYCLDLFSKPSKFLNYFWMVGCLLSD